MVGALFYACTFNHSTTAVSFFFFPVTGIPVCAEPGTCNKHGARYSHFLHSAYTGIPIEQWVQLVYGPRRNTHWRH